MTHINLTSKLYQGEGGRWYKEMVGFGQITDP